MRAVLAAMVLLVGAGCLQPGQEMDANGPDPAEITILVERSTEPDFGAQAVPEGSPAPDALVGFIYATTPSPGAYEALEGRAATPVDPDCRVTNNFRPDCSGWQPRESYRVPRDLEGAVNIHEIVDTAYPVDANSRLILVFPDPAEIFFHLYGPASEHYPAIQDEANGGVGCSQYRAADVTVLSGDARVTSTDASAPRLEFWGDATVRLGWSAFPSGPCSTESDGTE